MSKRASYLATVEAKSAWLSSEFGLDYAKKTFDLSDADIEAIVGRYTKGTRKGQLRGQITWLKCTRGGWVKTGQGPGGGERGPGFVVRPNRRWDHKIIDPWGDKQRNGDAATLWSATFRDWGWLPGETREQYDARNARPKLSGC